MTAGELRPDMPERFVDRRAMAELMGVSVNTIDRLRREGMPSVTWGLRTRRFRPSEALEWARQRGLDRRRATPGTPEGGAA
jgi:phage terminase Nu1 subunit (DNA packaging protein)